MNKLKYYLFYLIISLIISYSNRQMKTNNNDIDINMYLHFLSSTSLLEVPSCTCNCDVIIGTLTSMTMFSLCNRVTLCGLASPRLLRGLVDRIETSHSFKHGYNTGGGVVLYALVSPQWPHAWICGRVRTTLFPATKLWQCGINFGRFDVISLTVRRSLGSECVRWSRGLHRLMFPIFQGRLAVFGNFCDNARFWKLGVKSGASVVILVCQLGKEGLRA